MTDSDRHSPRALGLDPILERSGFNVAGALAASSYDAAVPPAWRCASLLPAAQRVLVLACGGRAFGRALLQAPEARSGPDPVDRFTARVVGEAATALAQKGQPTRALFGFERRAGQFADFVALGRAAGLGAPSRLGLLIHPRYGPWLAIRAVLLTAGSGPTTAPLAVFDPCAGCPAPCASACPVAAPNASGFEVAACSRHRLDTGGCRDRCAARRACPVGAVHAYGPAIERIHQAAALLGHGAPETRRG